MTAAIRPDPDVLEPIEQWRPVPDYEGLYEASDRGRVRSVDRTIARLGRWGPVEARLKGRTLRPHTADGYARVALSDGGRPRTHLVARLVLTAFRGEPPDGQAACHRNQIRSDNQLSNLFWGRRKALPSSRDTTCV